MAWRWSSNLGLLPLCPYSGGVALQPLAVPRRHVNRVERTGLLTGAKQNLIGATQNLIEATQNPIGATQNPIGATQNLIRPIQNLGSSKASVLRLEISL